MLQLKVTSLFKKELRKAAKRNLNLKKFHIIVETLLSEKPLPAKNKDHILIGNFKNCRECHITPDWLLIYRISNNQLILERTGSHSDLFKK